MKEKRPGLVDQPVFRVGVVLIALIAVFMIVQQISVPKSFGAYGYYRGDNVQEWVEREPEFSPGNGTCTTCHGDKQNSWGVAEHRQVSCESCHGSAGKHTRNPVELKPVVDNSREFCGVCHNSLATRPETSIRQVDVKTHNPGMNCTVCHDPHQPWAKLGGRKQ
ncbi:hypothetical protein SY88_12005 [Clostridiales bacterium PH28_bin88]|nr:hypothetical protein SY88_12005 [Clostridiales bacterium PH28_bin88]